MHSAACVAPNMNLDSCFVAYCVSVLSCPKYAVPTSGMSCCLSCVVHPDRPHRHASLYPLFSNQLPQKRSTSSGRVTLAVETKPINHFQCVFWVVRPEETFRIPCHFPRVQAQYVHRFVTLNTSRISCSRSSALSSGMQKMKSSGQCTQSASNIAPQYTHTALEATFAESFLHTNRKHLTCTR